jgi:hypothetical protein
MLSVKFRQSDNTFSDLLKHRILTVLLIFFFIIGCKEDPLIDRSFVTDQPCSAPCWQGIKINQSSSDNVITILHNLPFVEQSSIVVKRIKQGNGQGDRRITFDCSHPTQRRCGEITLTNDKVISIWLSVEYPLTLKEVVDKLGVPDYVTFDLYHPDVGGCIITIEYPNMGIAMRSVDTRSERACNGLEKGEGLNPKIRVDELRYQSPVEPHESSCTEPGCVRWPGFEKP